MYTVLRSDLARGLNMDWETSMEESGDSLMVLSSLTYLDHNRLVVHVNAPRS